MENIFSKICDELFKKLGKEEHLFVSISGENSQFIRFNGRKVRQTGFVDDAFLTLELISNSQKCGGGVTLTGNDETDRKNASHELERLHNEVVHLPKDPFIVLPEDKGSSRENHPGNLLNPNKVIDTLIPAMSDADLSGIWASGRIFVGNANSAGQTHWFSTDSFSLDYSLVTPDEKMVKANYSGTDWNQEGYEAYMASSVAKLKMMNRKAKKIEPGSYRTFIASAGVADILGLFSWGGVSEAAIQQGESAFCKMRNDNVRLSHLFTLKEDFSNGMVPRFNDMGEMSQVEIPIIVNGEMKNTLVSSRTAKEYNTISNQASEDEGLRSAVMSSGGLNEKDVLKTLGTGVYLSNLHYLNWSDRIGGRITGMTRYACFWVENGEVIAPIENMRFDDSIYNFFGDNLDAVTEKVHLNPSVETYDGRELGGITCPGVLLKSFELTL